MSKILNKIIHTKLSTTLPLVRLESATTSIGDEFGVQETVGLHVHGKRGVDSQETYEGHEHASPHVELKLSDIIQCNVLAAARRVGYGRKQQTGGGGGVQIMFQLRAHAKEQSHIHLKEQLFSSMPYNNEEGAQHEVWKAQCHMKKYSA